MGRFRVRFTEPQRLADVMPADALVSEVVVEADRLVLMRGGGVLVDVPPEVVAWAGPADAEPVEPVAGGMPDRDRPANEGKPWTEAESEALRVAWGQGATAAELRAVLGRSAGSIRSRARLLKLERGQ
jgi:hypothetical protein